MEHNGFNEGFEESEDVGGSEKANRLKDLEFSSRYLALIGFARVFSFSLSCLCFTFLNF